MLNALHNYLNNCTRRYVTEYFDIALDATDPGYTIRIMFAQGVI